MIFRHALSLGRGQVTTTTRSHQLENLDNVLSFSLKVVNKKMEGPSCFRVDDSCIYYSSTLLGYFSSLSCAPKFIISFPVKRTNC